MMVSKADHFRERAFAIPAGLDMANLTHRCVRSFRFHDQSNQLHDAPACFSDLCLTDTLDGVLQAVVRRWNCRGHKSTAFRSCSSLVSLNASTSPNRVCTMQPPRVTSVDAANRSGPVSGKPSSKG